MKALCVSRAPRAFSLTEVVVALAVLAIAVTSIFGALAAGLDSNHSSSEQTAAANLLTAIAADLRATPNPVPKGSAQTSHVYQIAIPAVGSGSSDSTPKVIYLADDGLPVSNSGTARFRASLWLTAPASGHAPTLARVLLTWPPAAASNLAQGTSEALVALDRN